MLIPVTDYGQAAQAVNAILLQSGATNGLPNQERLEGEIAQGTLFLRNEDYGLILLRRRPQWDHLTFLLRKGQSINSWSPERPTVVELPFRRETDPMKAVAEDLQNMGFRQILKRVRYTRKGRTCEPFPCDGVEECPERSEAYSLLEKNFSPLTGCIPTVEEWETLRNKGQILTLPGGVLHYEGKGNTTELRHLAVAEACRKQGLGRALVGAYLNRCGTGLSRVWTGEDNIAAQRLYESFGYEKDGWTSCVYYFDKE